MPDPARFQSILPKRKSFKFFALTFFLLSVVPAMRYKYQQSFLLTTEQAMLRDALATAQSFDGSGNDNSSELSDLNSFVRESENGDMPRSSVLPAVQAVPAADAGIITGETRQKTREVSRRLIPDIVGLGKDMPVPASVLERNDVNAVAESLVERLYRMTAKAAPHVADDNLVDLWTETELHKVAQSEKFADFVRTGIRNQFQTMREPDDSWCPDQNAVQEKLILAKLTDNFADDRFNALRPKYGVIFFPNGDSNWNTCPPFGDFILIFDDRLKLRSTLIKGDSAILPDRYKGFRPKTFWARLLKSQIPGQRKKMGDFDYWEFQTWGNISIEDVQAVGVLKAPGKNITPDQFQTLVINAGFKVIEFELYEDDLGNVFYRKLRTISEGDPTVRAQWIQSAWTGEIAGLYK